MTSIKRAVVAFLVLCVAGGTARAQDEPPLILHSAVGAGVADAIPMGNASADNSDTSFVVGRLERVQKNNGKAKRWAMVDGSGQVTAFVAPTSKYDLRRFVGKEIGLKARQLGAADGEPPFLVVDSVTPMFASEWNEAEENGEPSKTVLAAHESTVGTGTKAVRVATNPAANNPAVTKPLAKPATNQRASHVEMLPGQIVSGQVLPGEEWIESVPPTTGCMTGVCGSPSCTVCRQSTACFSTLPNTPSTCGPPVWMWIRGENLQWWSKGMSTPPLITTSVPGTPTSEAGVLGPASTSILYGGDDEILAESASGFRLRFGGWFGRQRKLGYEGEFFSLTSSEEEFVASSDANGLPILARPFFNLNPRLGGSGALNPSAMEDAEIISFPGLLRGTTTVSSFADVQGASAFFRLNKCCRQVCRPSCSDPRCGGCGGYGLGILGGGRCGYDPYCRTDLLAGYQYLQLVEGLRITEDLTSLDANNLGTFDIVDSFDTRNEFHGGVIGAAVEGGINRWTLELMMRVAVGAVNQSVTIDGETTITPLVTPAETFEGGLLAQRTNIGTFERSQFTMIPQLNANLGFYLTPRLRAVVGYSLIYWGNVVRPGDQISRDLNPDLLPPEVDPFTGPLRPEFAFQQNDYWIQGLNVGLDLSW